MTSIPLLLGIDSGQTACKAALFDLDGREVATAGVGNAISSPHPRWVERDMDELWHQVCDAVRSVTDAAAQRLQASIDIIGVGVCGHGDGAYLVDGDGRPVRPAILATDSRAADEAAVFGRGRVGRRALELTGQVPFDGSPASILAWLARHEPQTLSDSRWALFCKDFIRLRLTGEVATDPSEASASFVDVNGGGWSSTALGLFGLQDVQRLLPPILPSAQVAGKVTNDAAAATGLVAGTPVVTGAHDVDAAALGIGAHTIGDASAVLGTFSINQVVSDAPVVDSRWQARAFVTPGRWLHMSTSAAGATNLDWAVRQIGPWTAGGEPDLAAAIDQAHAVALEVSSGSARSASAPLFLPFLYGAPALHGRGPGAGWVDIHGRHERADLIFAVLEGVAFNHRTHLDALRESFAMERPLRVCGGGARSEYWTQLLADVVGLDVEVTDAQEPGARGVALLAGVGAGIFEDLGEAVARSVHVVRRQSPRPEESAVHTDRYERYLAAVTGLA